MNNSPIGQNESVDYRPDIDGLRAIAVVSVVAFHAFPTLVPGGYVGVDIFFVISGFLISSIIMKGLGQNSFSFADFYARRVLRIFPALIVVLTSCLIFGWFTLVPHKYQQLGQEIEAGTTFVANILFWRQSGYFDTAAEAKPLLHLWSLGVEEQFYIVWPLMLYLCARARLKTLPVILAVMTVSFAANCYAVRIEPADAFYLPHTRFWELLAGAVLAWFKLSGATRIKSAIDQSFQGRTGRTISLADLESFIGLCLIAVALYRLNKDSLFPGWRALLPVGGAFLLISAGQHAWFNRNVLSNRVIVFIGLVSYPLYLWHWPVLYFVRTNVFEPSAAQLAGAIALSVLLAWLTYFVVELPLRRSKTRWRSLRVSATATAAVMAMVLGAGFATNIANGLPQRNLDNVASVLQYRKYNYWVDYRNDYCLLFGKEQVFSPICVEADRIAAGAPVLAIWGDSHGAHLYRGIQDNPASDGFAIAQFTSSSCPPVFDFDKAGAPLCRTINDSVRREFGKIRPKVVVLAHDWPQSEKENALDRLAGTVDVLRGMGAERIVLIGPVPHWEGTLPDVLSRYVGEHHQSNLPGRLTFGVVHHMEDIDRDMAERATRLGIEYISPIKQLCNADGCLTMVPDAPDIPMAWDAAHFTREGSRYFINLVADKLFVQPRLGSAAPANALTR
jgi:peptidoglycan/LPS O-acetylase OafA/YrhL